MNIKQIVILTLYLFFSSFLPQAQAISPYGILGLSSSASDSQIENKYRHLRSKYRRNRIKKNMLKQAYNQIMVERNFNQPRESELPEFGVPKVP